MLETHHQTIKGSEEGRGRRSQVSNIGGGAALVHELLYLCDHNARDVWVSFTNTPSRGEQDVDGFYRSESTPNSSLASYLLLDPEDDKGIDFEFINEAVRRFEEDDTIKPAFISAVEQLSAQLAEKDVNSDHQPYSIVCRLFSLQSPF